MKPTTLFCLPYAGGSSAVFRGWQQGTPAWLSVETLHLPGRGIRHQEALQPNWDKLIERLLDDVTPFLDRRIALFGHSLGALLSFELAHAMRERHGVEPCWLGVSACPAPSYHKTETHWLNCPSQTVLDELLAFGQTDPALLQNPEFVDLILPIVRNDFHLYGSYRTPPRAHRPVLRCALKAFGGLHDDVNRDPQTLLAWAKETHGDFDLATFDGGHFFIASHRESLIDDVVNTLRTPLAGTPLIRHEQLFTATR